MHISSWLKRFASAIGRALWAGLLGLLELIGRLLLKVVTPIAATATAVVVAFFLIGHYFFGLPWPWQGMFAPSKEQLELEERARIDDAFIACAALGGADDGTNPQERLAAAITIVNVAFEKAARIEKVVDGKKIVEVIGDTCSVFEKFESLMAPGNSTTARRWQWNVRMFSVAQPIYDQTARQLRAYLADPKPFLRERPWLASPTRMIRTTWRGFAPYPDASMRTSMCRLYGQPGVEAEFFRYKKSPDDKCE